jgi:hypothetical protein
MVCNEDAARRPGVALEGSGRNAAGAAHSTFPQAHQRRGASQAAEGRARRLRA